MSYGIGKDIKIYFMSFPIPTRTAYSLREKAVLAGFYCYSTSCTKTTSCGFRKNCLFASRESSSCGVLLLSTSCTKTTSCGFRKNCLFTLRKSSSCRKIKLLFILCAFYECTFACIDNNAVICVAEKWNTNFNTCIESCRLE